MGLDDGCCVVRCIFSLWFVAPAGVFMHIYTVYRWFVRVGCGEQFLYWDKLCRKKNGGGHNGERCAQTWGMAVWIFGIGCNGGHVVRGVICGGLEAG